jgi:hypothetical protein
MATRKRKLPADGETVSINARVVMTRTLANGRETITLQIPGYGIPVTLDARDVMGWD